MKILVDFLPIVLFFITYHLTKNMVLATAVLIPATVLQVLFVWWRTGRIEKMHVITLVLVVVLGGATILLQDDQFIMWKPTIVNLAFAVAFLVSPLFGGKPLIQRMMEKNVQLPSHIWHRLNVAWVVFFIVLAIVNILVFHWYSKTAWVNFKLFGMLGLTLVFVVGQGLYLSRHATLQDTSSTTDKES